MSGSTISFNLGFGALVVGAWMAPNGQGWIVVVAAGLLSGLWGVAKAISERKS